MKKIMANYVLSILLTCVLIATTSLLVTADSYCGELDLVWQRISEENYYDLVFGVAATSDYVYVSGATLTWLPGFDALILKYDHDGNLLWERTWGGTYEAVAYRVAAAPDCVYISGQTGTFNGGGRDAFLLKYDSDGNLLWEQIFGGIGDDGASSVAIASDAIYVSGNTDSYYGNVFLRKYDPDGSMIWERIWGESGIAGNSLDIAITADRIYVTGRTSDYSTGETNAFLLKYDSEGNLLWERSWNEYVNSFAWSVAAASNAVYVSGFIEDYAKETDAFLRKYDPDGNLIWEQIWGGNNADEANGVAVNQDGIYVTGRTRSYGAGEADAFLLIYNSDGILLCEETWGGSYDDSAYDIAIATGDIIYVSGVTQSYGAGWQNAFLLKYQFTPSLNQPPIAEAGPDQIVAVSVPVTFDGSGSYDPDGHIVEYAWDFGDGNYGYGVTTTHTYLEEGEHTVTLTVTDDGGLTDTDMLTIKTTTEFLDEIDDYFQDLPDAWLKSGNPKTPFHRQIEAVKNQIEDENYQGAINHLKEIRDNKVSTWITSDDPDAQQAKEELIQMINELIDYLKTLI